MWVTLPELDCLVGRKRINRNTINLCFVCYGILLFFFFFGILKYLLYSYNLNHMNAGLLFYLDVKKVSGRPEDKHFVLLVVYLPPTFL